MKVKRPDRADRLIEKTSHGYRWTPVVQIAQINTFVCTVTVPEHEVTLHRKLGRVGELLRGGRFAKAPKSNFTFAHTVRAQTSRS